MDIARMNRGPHINLQEGYACIVLSGGAHWATPLKEVILKEYDECKSMKHLLRKSMNFCGTLFIPLTTNQHNVLYI